MKMKQYKANACFEITDTINPYERKAGNTYTATGTTLEYQRAMPSLYDEIVKLRERITALEVIVQELKYPKEAENK